jgi:hypothetical protein
MAIARWSPFRDLEVLDQRLRRLFDEAGVAAPTFPNADVYETDDEYVVEVGCRATSRRISRSRCPSAPSL